MIGDIVLYKNTGKWYEKLITLATNGPYVHAEILIDTNKTIGERINGVCLGILPPDKYTLCSPNAPQELRQEGIEWALSMRGRSYGWLDVLDAGLRYLTKNKMPFHLIEDNHYDCSCFVVRYLEVIGLRLPPSMTDAHEVSPNDLARYFGLLHE